MTRTMYWVPRMKWVGRKIKDPFMGYEGENYDERDFWSRFMGHSGKVIEPFVREQLGGAEDSKTKEYWLEKLKWCQRHRQDRLWSDFWNTKDVKPLTCKDGTISLGGVRLMKDVSSHEFGETPPFPGLSTQMYLSDINLVLIPVSINSNEFMYIERREIHPEDRANLPWKLFFKSYSEPPSYRWGKRRMCEACRDGDIPLIKWLLERGANVRFSSYKPVWLAIKNNHLDVVKLILTPDTPITLRVLRRLQHSAAHNSEIKSYLSQL